MRVYEIPLTAGPQTFGVSLAGVEYRLTIYWADAPGGGWILDIADVNGARLVSGILMATGVDLLAPYAYLGFIGSLIVQTDHDPDALPTFANLGATSHLFYVTA